MRCCPMAESLFILELEFLRLRGGCSLIIMFFVLMLVGTCCFILSSSLCVVHPIYRASWNFRRSSKIVLLFKCFGISLHKDSTPILV